jgi:hypothetical protein
MSGLQLEVAMNTASSLSILKQELEFLDKGGYRKSIGFRQPAFCMETSVEWRQPLFFEDSPSCPKKRYEACSTDRNCVLMDLVPSELRHETVPCRHIPLNEQGDTIASLTRGGAKEKQIEVEMRNWLVKAIARLDQSTAIPSEPVSVSDRVSTASTGSH